MQEVINYFVAPTFKLGM